MMLLRFPTRSSATDNEVLVAAKADDTEAFRRLLRRHQSMVFSIALHATGRRELAEEITQEVFLSLHKHLPVIETPAHLKNWLRRTTINRVIDNARKTTTPLQYLDGQEPTVEQASSHENQDPWKSQRLQGALLQLPMAQRLALTLRYQEDLDPKEIAACLDAPVNTVKSHLARGLQALRNMLSKTGALTECEP